MFNCSVLQLPCSSFNMVCYRHKSALMPFFPLPRGKQISKLVKYLVRLMQLEKKKFSDAYGTEAANCWQAWGLLKPSGSPQCAQRLQRRHQPQQQLQGRL